MHNLKRISCYDSKCERTCVFATNNSHMRAPLLALAADFVIRLIRSPMLSSFVLFSPILWQTKAFICQTSQADLHMYFFPLSSVCFINWHDSSCRRSLALPRRVSAYSDAPQYRTSRDQQISSVIGGFSL